MFELKGKGYESSLELKFDQPVAAAQWMNSITFENILANTSTDGDYYLHALVSDIFFKKNLGSKIS